MQNFQVKEVKQCFSEPTEKTIKKRGISHSKHWICAYKSHSLGSALKSIKTNKLYTKLYLKQKNWVFTGKSLMNTQYGAGDRTWRALPVIRYANTRLCSASPRPVQALLYRKQKNIEKPQKVISLYLVPVTGLEPVRCCHRGILSPLRLPIPPHRHSS